LKSAPTFFLSSPYPSSPIHSRFPSTYPISSPIIIALSRSSNAAPYHPSFIPSFSLPPIPSPRLLLHPIPVFPPHLITQHPTSSHSFTPIFSLFFPIFSPFITSNPYIRFRKLELARTRAVSAGMQASRLSHQGDRSLLILAQNIDLTSLKKASYSLPSGRHGYWTDHKHDSSYQPRAKKHCPCVTGFRDPSKTFPGSGYRHSGDP